MTVNEKLDNYWRSLNGMDQKRWFTKEVYLRKLFNIRLIDNKALKKLRMNKRGRSCISNEANYDILSVNRYSDAFFYSNMEIASERFASDIVA